jgi:ribonucleoside-diphosphate reductase alpha chain
MSSDDISRYVWRHRYRVPSGPGDPDADIDATWQRVASACAAIEGDGAARWFAEYMKALRGFRFLPGGRILAGAGRSLDVTLLNCFVMGSIEDNPRGVRRALDESAATLRQGGGIGCDFSTLRPRGSNTSERPGTAPGPVALMHTWEAMCSSLDGPRARGGAMMATLRCDHPDIGEFVNAKTVRGTLRHFNLSVQVSDAFIKAVRNDDEWPLVFPDTGLEKNGNDVLRKWTGFDEPVSCRLFNRVRARELWHEITRAAHATGEPGVLFVDTVNRENNLYYREEITTTNPCGELPLPPYGACDLGSINLPQFVRAPFSPDASLDLAAIRTTVCAAVHLLDTVIDQTRYPLEAQRTTATGSRRVGLGVTGLADALMLLGAHYDSDEGRAQASAAMRVVCQAAYESSIELARERGPFPYLDRDAYLESAFVRRLPSSLRDGIAQHGIRNSHLLAVAPTGSISLLANNVSPGIEPAFALSYQRRVRVEDGEERVFDLENFALQRWRAMHGNQVPPGQFVSAHELTPHSHLEMVAALQPWVDSSISKTINLPEDYPFEAMQQVFDEAHDRGLKGCTVYRPRATDRSPLEAKR